MRIWQGPASPLSSPAPANRLRRCGNLPPRVLESCGASAGARHRNRAQAAQAARLACQPPGRKFDALPTPRYGLEQPRRRWCWCWLQRRCCWELCCVQGGGCRGLRVQAAAVRSAQHAVFADTTEALQGHCTPQGSRLLSLCGVLVSWQGALHSWADQRIGAKDLDDWAPARSYPVWARARSG